VGNPGNAADTRYNPAGYGSVSYVYRICKHEVTNMQYTEFLNAVAATDPYGLYNTSMGSDTFGGITRSGSSGSYTYSVKGDAVGQGPGGADGDDYTYANKPVACVSFLDAMRFANWLENGQPTGAQGPGTTEDGVYSVSDGLSEVRDPNATFFIPSEDEWYKAAYYDPSGVYYDYPTSTGLVPNNNLPSSDTGNSVNFYDSRYTTGHPYYPMTDVGAYSLSESPYGTFDQGGNQTEWTETVPRSSRRSLRGGSWADRRFSLRAAAQNANIPTNEFHGVGFRVASIPEPSTMLLGVLVCLGLLRLRRR
jgi:formylglycine-generating enzyme required for sulfatase activity